MIVRKEVQCDMPGKKLHCHECASIGQTRYHGGEVVRIKRELDELGAEFSADGPVRWILRERVKQERRRVRGTE